MVTEQLLDELAAGEGELLSRAAKRFASSRQGRPRHLSCLVRYAQDGVPGPNGQRVYLEAAKIAGKLTTTPAAVRRFIAAQNPDAASEPLPAPRSPGRRQRASEQAARQLERLGI